MQVSEAEKEMYIETAKQLKGHARRLYMARVVKALGRGGQLFASQAFGWDRNTIRKGTRELETGFICYDNYAARGRRRAEEKLPNLLDDIKAILDEQSQADPTFKSTRLYTRLSAAEVRKQLIDQKEYTDDELPSEETIRHRINQLGYRLRSVQKSRPKKDR
jgi:hypothetical protein